MHEDPKRDPKQAAAIAYSTWEEHNKKHNSTFLRKMELLNTSGEWVRLRDFLLIEKAELLGPGTWTGEDGVPTYYSPDVITKANQTILGKPIKITHADKAETVVGFWDAYKDIEGKTVAQGIVWHPVGVKYFSEHPGAKLSIEAGAKCMWNATSKRDEVLAMEYNGGAAVEIPAYPSGGVEQQRLVTLSARMEVTNLSDGEIKTKGKENNMQDENKPPESQAPPPVTAPPTPPPTTTTIPPVQPPPPVTQPPIEKAPETPAKKPEDEDLKKQIEALRTELATSNAAINGRLEEDVLSLSAEVKAIDNGFDQAKYLEGITDKTLQKKMLGSHLESLKRVNPHPIVIKLSDAEMKTKVNAASKSLFGMDAEDLFKSLGFEVKKPGDK